MRGSVRKVSNPGSSMTKVRRNVQASRESLCFPEADPRVKEDESDLSPTQIGYIGIGAVIGVVLLGLLASLSRRCLLKPSFKSNTHHKPFHPDLLDNPLAHGQLHQHSRPSPRPEVFNWAASSSSSYKQPTSDSLPDPVPGVDSALNEVVPWEPELLHPPPRAYQQRPPFDLMKTITPPSLTVPSKFEGGRGTPFKFPPQAARPLSPTLNEDPVLPEGVWLRSCRSPKFPEVRSTPVELSSISISASWDTAEHLDNDLHVVPESELPSRPAKTLSRAKLNFSGPRPSPWQEEPGRGAGGEASPIQDTVLRDDDQQVYEEDLKVEQAYQANKRAFEELVAETESDCTSAEEGSSDTVSTAVTTHTSSSSSPSCTSASTTLSGDSSDLAPKEPVVLRRAAKEPDK